MREQLSVMQFCCASAAYVDAVHLCFARLRRKVARLHRPTPDAPDLGSGPSEISAGSGFADDPQARTRHKGWPVAKLSARNSASVRRAIRSSIWGCLHRASNCADRHALSEYAFLVRMLQLCHPPTHQDQDQNTAVIAVGGPLSSRLGINPGVLIIINC